MNNNWAGSNDYGNPSKHSVHQHDEIGIMRPNCEGCKEMFSTMLEAVQDTDSKGANITENSNKEDPKEISKNNVFLKGTDPKMIALMLALHDLECGCNYPLTHLSIWEGTANQIVWNLRNNRRV